VGVEQVNKAMTQMDTVTQTNASQTEELSATAQSMAAGSEELQAMVARFRLDAGGVRQGQSTASASSIAYKPKSGNAHGGKPARKPLTRHPAATAAPSSAGTGNSETTHDEKEREHAFEEF
jgi:methyl-accepting chemotaxis protein